MEPSLDVAQILSMDVPLARDLLFLGFMTTGVTVVVATLARERGIDLVAGLALRLFRPFELGDVITAAGHTGAVVHLGLLHTTLESTAGQRIALPNGRITEGSTLDLSQVGTRRVQVDIAVEHGADLERVRSILARAARRCRTSLAHPSPAVAFAGLGPAGVAFKVFAWCSAHEHDDLVHELRCNLYDDLNAAGIAVPFEGIVSRR